MGFITSIEHAYAVALGDLKKAGNFVLHTVLPALKAVDAAAPQIEAVSATISPQLANIERTGEAWLAKAIKVIEDAGSAADAGGLSVTLDQQLVSDIKAILPAVKAQAAPMVAGLPSKTPLTS